MAIPHSVFAKFRKVFHQDPEIDIEERLDDKLIKLDRKTLYAGQLSGKYRFVIIILLLNNDIENCVDFANMIHDYGGATFICLYVFISFVVVLPIYILEIGLSQFYSRTVLNIFEIVPLFKGLGRSMILLNICALITNSTLICSSLMYLTNALFVKRMPWTYCPPKYDKILCVNSTLQDNQIIDGKMAMTPSDMFWYFEIQGTKDPLTGMSLTVQDGIGKIRINFLISMLVVWMAISVFSCFVLQLYTKAINIFYFVLLGVTLLLILRSFLLPKSMVGVFEFLQPNITKTLTLKSLQEAVSHSIISTCLGSATISSIGSLNKFNYDFFEMSKLIVIVNTLSRLMFATLLFSIFGYTAFLENIKVEQFKNLDKIKFTSFVDAVSKLKDGRILVVVYMLLCLNMEIMSLSIGVAGVMWSLMESFSNVFRFSNLRKLAFTVLFCVPLCTFSLFFSFNGAIFYRTIINTQLKYVTIPFIIIIEIVIVYYIYGANRFRGEIKMMLRYSYNCFWIVCGNILIPIFMTISLSYTFYITSEDRGASSKANTVSYIISFLFIIPMLLCLGKEILIYSRLYNYKEILPNILKASETLGPYYKINWLKGKVYQKKLVKLRKEPEFLLTIRETEDLNEVLLILQESLKKKKARKERENPKKAVHSKKSRFDY